MDKNSNYKNWRNSYSWWWWSYWKLFP